MFTSTSFSGSHVHYKVMESTERGRRRTWGLGKLRPGGAGALRESMCAARCYEERSVGAREDHLFLGWCLFMCNAKWSERANERSQIRHLKGFWPVCFR